MQYMEVTLMTEKKGEYKETKKRRRRRREEEKKRKIALIK